jgi:hypothetical protein
VRGINLWLRGDACLLEMRGELLSEPPRCLFRFPHIDYPKAVRAVSGRMDEEALFRPI